MKTIVYRVLLILTVIIVMAGFMILAYAFIKNYRGVQNRTCVSNMYLLNTEKRHIIDRLVFETDAEVRSDDPELILRFNDFLRLKPDLRCPSSGTYEVGPIGSPPTCSYQAPWWDFTKYKKHDIND